MATPVSVINANLTTLQTTFSSGELDPLMRFRVDVESYFQGLKTGRNIALLAQGGIRRRPGSIYRAVLDNPTVLHEFSYGDGQSYILAFSNTKCKIFNDVGTLLTTLTSAPWSDSELNDLTLTSSGDTTIVCHTGFFPQRILRTGASTFTLADFDFEQHSSGAPRYQPYYKYASAAITLNPSGTTGSINVVTSADYWTSDDAGTIIRYKSKEILLNTYTNATTMAATVRETLPSSTADVDWDEATFSVNRGHPRAVTFHDKRLCFAGNLDRPDGFWASKTNAYFNFDVGTGLDAEAIDVSVTADRVAEVRHLVSTRNLQVFSNGGELYIPQSQANPLTPTNISFIQQTPYGANQAVNPIKFDGATLFMQRTGKVVREYIFSDTEQSYTSGAVSLRSNHLIGTSVDGTAMLGTNDRPEQYAFFVKLDGDLAVFHSVRNEQLSGWVLWTTDGDFKSITAVENKVFAAVERNINGSDVVWLEEFDWDITLDAAKEFAADEDRVTNGTFDTDASWTKGTGWTIDGSNSNSADCDGTASSDSDLEQAITATSGNVYQVRFTISNYSAGALIPRVANGAGTAVSANGTYIQYITASSGSNLQMRADSDFVGSIDTIIVKEVTKSYTSAHLVSEAVKVVTNDAAQYVGAYTTDGSGIVTVDEFINGADVGLDYSMTIETMPIDAPGRQSGGVTGTKKRISKVVLSIIASQAVTLENNKLILTQTTQDFSIPPTAVEGEYQFFTLGWSLNPTITISQGEPLPLTVRGLYVEVKV